MATKMKQQHFEEEEQQEMQMTKLKRKETSRKEVRKRMQGQMGKGNQLTVVAVIGDEAATAE